jgi:hypothetical protein
VTADPTALASVIVGDTTLATAIRTGEIEVTGSTEMTRAFRRWFGLSPFSQVKRPRGPLASASG